jgi:HKD family nuclease
VPNNFIQNMNIIKESRFTHEALLPRSEFNVYFDPVMDNTPNRKSKSEITIENQNQSRLHEHHNQNKVSSTWDVSLSQH